MPAHAVYKTDAFLRLLGFRRPPRQLTARVPRPTHGDDGYGDGAPYDRAAIRPRERGPAVLAGAAALIGLAAILLWNIV